MTVTPLIRKLSWIYLLLVPPLAAASGFGIGKISYAYYLPIWIINVVLMVTASWILGLHLINKKTGKTQLIAGAFFLIVPWILVSMFFGLGPPPEKAADWVASATEQQVRYSMLAVAGVFVAFGFSLLKEKLKNEGENYYSVLGYIAIIIAIPLFILDMLFWGYTLTESNRILVSTNTEELPDWFRPLRVLFGMISVVEVSLTYLAIAFFAASMNRVGWLGKTASGIYAGISLFALMLLVLSVFLPQPFITAGFAVSIPAIPFLMPYYMAVNLLKKTSR